jgi:hypothetical protein
MRGRFFGFILGVVVSSGGLVRGLSGCNARSSSIDTASDVDASNVGDALNVEDTSKVDAGAPNVTVTIDRTRSMGAIPPRFVGLSYEKASLIEGLFRSDNAALLAFFHLLGPSVLRLGGNTVDESAWAPESDAGHPDGGETYVVTPSDIDAMAGFTRASGWKVLYGVNMKTSTASIAANEAAYAAGELGSSLLGFEIGNEPDHYGVSFASWEANWSSFASAIRGAIAGAVLTGPATGTNVIGWTLPFATDEGGAIALLTQHYYRGSATGPNATIGTLISPDPALVGTLRLVENAANADVHGAYRLAECNSFSQGGAPGVSDAFASALWVIDFLFANAAYGSSGVNLHGGDNGIAPIVYTPIANHLGVVLGARPIFYGMLLFVRAGTGTLLATTSAPASLDLSAYAVQSGSVTHVVLVNKMPVVESVAVELGDHAASADALVLTAAGLDAADGVTFGGAAIDSSGSFDPEPPQAVPVSGGSLMFRVPAESAVLLTLR